MLPGTCTPRCSSTPADLAASRMTCAHWVPDRVEVAGVPRVAAVYVWGERRTDGSCAARMGHRQHHDVSRRGCGTGKRRVGDMFRRPRARGLTGLACDDHRVRARHSRSTAPLSEHSYHRRPFARIDRRGLSGRESPTRTNVRNMLLLAPTCSLSHVLERWASQRGLPRGLVAQISRRIGAPRRRFGVALGHQDTRFADLGPGADPARPHRRVGAAQRHPPDRSGYPRGCP